MELNLVSPVTYVLLLAFVFCVVEGLSTNRAVKKSAAYPLVGSRFSLLPRSLFNLQFAFNSSSLLEKGYRKLKAGAFQIVRSDANIVVLPNSLLEELSRIPFEVASPHGALEHDLLGPYTGLNLILDSRLHHTIVQRKLTPRLNLLTPNLEKELSAAFEDYLPSDNDWSSFRPYQVLGLISARLAGMALVGPSLCADPLWLDISVNYTENMFQTIVVLRLFPTWARSIVCRLLPSYWQCHRYVTMAKKFLTPRLRELLRKNDEGEWTPQPTVADSNVLSWLVEAARGRDRNPDTIAHVEVLLALAAVHTTLLRMVNVLYDLTANPHDLSEVRAEIVSVSKDGTTWDAASYSKLSKLDSVLAESQRMSPPSILGLKRMFKQPYTFANGMHVEKDTYVCLPTYAIENDPEQVKDPHVFDGLRSYRKRLELQTSLAKREDYLFTSPSPSALSFGYGKAACPGRHFADLLLKMLFAKLLMEYDFSFLQGQGRPRNLVAHEFLFTWPWQKLLIKKHGTRSSPLF